MNGVRSAMGILETATVASTIADIHYQLMQIEGEISKIYPENMIFGDYRQKRGNLILLKK